jgi:hypothetical protein
MFEEFHVFAAALIRYYAKGVAVVTAVQGPSRVNGRRGLQQLCAAAR